MAQMSQASKRLNERRLVLARTALAAFETGLYGNCKRCEEAIAFRRLKARPESPLCLRCQEQLER